MRLSRVSAFLANVTQQIHSLRARARPDEFRAGAYDYRLPYTSIPLALRLFRDADIPTGSYLKTDPHKTDSWKRRFAGFDKPVIGLAWRGRDKPRYRSIALEELAGIFNSSGFQFLALQKDLTDEERKFLSKFPNVIDLSGNLRDFDDTASALESTDLVITIDTAIAHLAGAIGKETWVLLKLGAAWRWKIEGSTSSWYKTAKLFRQTEFGDWRPVLQEIHTGLAGKSFP